MRKSIVTLMTMLLVIGIAAAATYADLSIDPKTQTIDITGSPNPVKTYTVTLETDDPAGSDGALVVNTDDPAIWAEIGDTTPDVRSSIYPFTVAGTPDANGIITMTFSLYATVDEANEASVNNENHAIKVKYFDTEGEVIAMVTGRLDPIPELSTSILTAAGMVGLFGLVRLKRKD